MFCQILIGTQNGKSGLCAPNNWCLLCQIAFCAPTPLLKKHPESDERHARYQFCAMCPGCPGKPALYRGNYYARGTAIGRGLPVGSRREPEEASGISEKCRQLSFSLAASKQSAFNVEKSAIFVCCFSGMTVESYPLKKRNCLTMKHQG